MGKFLLCIALLSFTSCHTYDMLDGKSRPVYFNPDSSVFNDSDFNHPTVRYEDLQHLNGNFTNIIELRKGEKSVAIINQPTFFRAYGDFLVYPGEHITITKGKHYSFTFIKKRGSKRRNKELSFFETITQIKRYPNFPSLSNVPLDTFLKIERNQKTEILKFNTESKQLFDSLAHIFKVSKKFKRLAAGYVENKFDLIYGLYKSYRDTLETHGLYKEKLKQLIPRFNAITEKSKLNGTIGSFNEIANEVLPYKILKVANDAEFRYCFDSIVTNFNALAKDYLLSQLMYRAYIKRIHISSDYMVKYKNICYDKPYKKIIFNLQSQQEKSDDNTLDIGDNNLLSLDGKEVSSLKNILAKHKGKIIIIDFWATWCAPCREETPYFKKLIREYSDDKTVFLSISLDRETQRWQKDVIANNTETKNNYLMLNSERSSFVQQFDIRSIPRYMLINKEGKIVDTDTARPSDPKLKELLDKYLAY